MSSSGSEISRVSIEVPTPYSPAMAAAIGKYGVGQNLRIEPASVPPSELYTMLEDPNKQVLIAAVQRPHIRAFTERSGQKHLGVGERLINGLWISGPSAMDSPKELQWGRMRPTVVLDRTGRITALKARRITDLHRLLTTRAINIMGVGDMTIDFLGELSEAVQAELALSS